MNSFILNTKFTNITELFVQPCISWLQFANHVSSWLKMLSCNVASLGDAQMGVNHLLTGLSNSSGSAGWMSDPRPVHEPDQANRPTNPEPSPPPMLDPAPMAPPPAALGSVLHVMHVPRAVEVGILFSTGPAAARMGAICSVDSGLVRAGALCSTCPRDLRLMPQVVQFLEKPEWAPCAACILDLACGPSLDKFRSSTRVQIMGIHRLDLAYGLYV